MLRVVKISQFNPNPETSEPLRMADFQPGGKCENWTGPGVIHGGKPVIEDVHESDRPYSAEIWLRENPSTGFLEIYRSCIDSS